MANIKKNLKFEEMNISRREIDDILKLSREISFSKDEGLIEFVYMDFKYNHKTYTHVEIDEDTYQFALQYLWDKEEQTIDNYNKWREMRYDYQ